MKKMRFITAIAIVLFMTGYVPELGAQANEMKKVFDKLVGTANGNMEFRYVGSDKSMPVKTSKVTISDKSTLDEFLKVFDQSKKSADMVHTSRKGSGEVNSAIFNVKGTSHMYSYFVQDDSNAFVIYSEYNDAASAKKGSEQLSSDDIKSEMKQQQKWKKIADIWQSGELTEAAEPGFFQNLGRMSFSSANVSRISFSTSDPASIDFSGADKFSMLDVPFRVDIKGKCLITDGDQVITAEDSLGFGTTGGKKGKAGRPVTIVLDKKTEISIDGEKCTVEQAREKGLNIVVF